jgi:hypothetical protein
MACHLANMPFMALQLGYPTSVIAENSDAAMRIRKTRVDASGGKGAVKQNAEKKGRCHGRGLDKSSRHKGAG